MALRSKLLDEKVVESAKEMLKKVRNNAYVSKKLNAVIAAKKYSITAVAKIYCISRSALGSVDKILEKPYKSSNKIEKTRKNLSSFIKSGKNTPKIFNFTRERSKKCVKPHF